MDYFKIHVGVTSDIGNVKQVNQDNVLVEIGEHKGEEFGLFLVCDGLGGLSQGEVASLIAVKSFKDWWETKLASILRLDEDDLILESLEETVASANKKIIRYSEEMNSKVGTTVAALFIHKKKYYVINVGDSRVYRINGGITQESEDHSYVAQKVRNKEMTKKEAQNSKEKNILLQCVGVKQEIQIHKKVGYLEKTKAFILCSDGFYNKLSEKEIKQSIKAYYENPDEELQETAVNLIEMVKQREEKDNISVIIVLLDYGQYQKKGLFSRLFYI